MKTVAQNSHDRLPLKFRMIKRLPRETGSNVPASRHVLPGPGQICYTKEVGLPVP